MAPLLLIEAVVGGMRDYDAGAGLPVEMAGRAWLFALPATAGLRRGLMSLNSMLKKTVVCPACPLLLLTYDW